MSSNAYKMCMCVCKQAQGVTISEQLLNAFFTGMVLK